MNILKDTFSREKCKKAYELWKNSYICRQVLVRQNDLLYVLKDGKINIYKSDKFQENTLSSSDDDTEIDSVSAKKRITAFDVSDDGKIMITGDEGGIRKWERIGYSYSSHPNHQPICLKYCQNCSSKKAEVKIPF